MIKVVLLVRRKAGLTRGEFRAHYETTHAPLAASLLRHCVGYTRNFVQGPDDGSGPDCVTEFYYDLQPPWENARHLVADDAIRATLVADERNFMDRASMRTYVVDECRTASAALG